MSETAPKIAKRSPSSKATGVVKNEKLQQAKGRRPAGTVKDSAKPMSNRKSPRATSGLNSTNLTDEVRLYILSGHAEGEKRPVIVAGVKSEFGLEISPQTVSNYNPRTLRGQSLPPHLLEWFAKRQAEYHHRVRRFGFTNKEARLARLHSMAIQAQETGNMRMELQVLEQIARETGGYYEKTPDKGGGSLEMLAQLLDLPVSSLPPTDAQLRQREFANKRGW